MSEDVEKAAVRTGVRVSRRLSVGLTVATGVLTVFGPLSLDLYRSVLPAITREFRTSDSIAQVTLSACLVGLAIGQLVAGPL